MIVRAINDCFELKRNKCYVAENYDKDYYIITLGSEDRRLFLKSRFIIVDNDSVYKEGYTGGYTLNRKGPEGELPNTPITPKHYKRGIETWDYTDSWGMDFLEGSIIKYVTRWRDKNGIEDLKKANQFLLRLIEREENK
ncbi:hypothetical protein [Susfortunavirus gdyzp5]|uniref:DUF3310 domain-containing protein n=1 Tax=Clostridium phage vB_CP_qdyz_P5 TaxID=3003728 RepID=A0AAE9VE18_9CAUD|nr:hypothetical protein [Clostridium phage vB_CP_qdyz_P5]